MSAMDQLNQLFDAFDMLDIVLAAFGAVIVSLWFGRGKSLGGLLAGAAMGGIVKPLCVVMLTGGVLIAAGQAPELTQTPEQQDKIVKFWSK
ncbi:hypothetical protein [Aestuariivirga sp.]|uniref:hypothetical protein n=1 Tax=Aestuariivirga sp. TaxID=2650926 RepID=UPI0039E4F91C